MHQKKQKQNGMLSRIGGEQIMPRKKTKRTTVSRAWLKTVTKKK